MKAFCLASCKKYRIFYNMTENKAKLLSPLPLFDSMEYINHSTEAFIDTERYYLSDIEHARAFLKAYNGSQGTFNAYRREIERLLHWSALAAKKPLKDLRRQDMEAFVEFCQNPPQHWIGTQKPPRFIIKNGQRTPNMEWRPFVVTVSKSAYRKGETPNLKNFRLSQGAVRELFAIISSFYNYLLQEEYVDVNPVALIRQKSKFIRRNQGQHKIRRLSETQWQYVIQTVTKMAEENPDIHQRSLFILSALYSMYLRISELAAGKRWEPLMNHFFRDNEGCWWFTTVGKGNKERQIAVSDTMLDALRAWRKHLNLSSLPSPGDNSPLLPRMKGKGPMQSINHIRRIVQLCFDKAVEQLQRDNLPEEAESLLEATVHWLRHTGISDDVKHRPREHVRDDAGHSSSAITDKYIDIELRERHRSARKKTIAEV